MLFWDPAGTQKSTKNGPGAEEVRPETAPEAIFVDFSRRCRSESLSGPIFPGQGVGLGFSLSDPKGFPKGPEGVQY